MKDEFKINFYGLRNGEHDWFFNIKDNIFSDDALFFNPQIALEIQLQKQETMLVWQFKHQGEVETNCDRCLDKITCSVKGNNRLIVKFGEEETFDNESILTLPHHHTQINLLPFVIDYLQFSLPWIRHCEESIDKEKTCNQAMLKKIEHLKPGNTLKNKKQADSRWDQLKKFKSK